MKKSGFSLIEIIIVIGIMGIIMLIISPMIGTFVEVQDRFYNQSRVDSRLNEIVDFIKRDVRNSKNSSYLGGKPVGVFDKSGNLITDGSVGKKVVIYTKTLDGDKKYVQYTLNKKELKLKITENFVLSNGGTTLLTNVADVEFKYKDKILLFYIKIDVPDRLEGKVRNEVRDIGISKANIE